MATTNALRSSVSCFGSRRPKVFPARPINGRSTSGGSLPADSKFLTNPSMTFASISLAASLAMASSVLELIDGEGAAMGGTLGVRSIAVGGLIGFWLCERMPDISSLPHSCVVSASCMRNSDWLPRQGLIPRRCTRTPNSCACWTPTRMSSSPESSTASAITRLRASVIMSVTIKESTPFCWPALLTKPRRTFTLG